ncbi:MAG: cytochrome b562 [Nibricoccus sp.]
MKIKNLLLAVSLSLPFSLTVHAQEPKKEPRKEHKAETELEGKMDEMGGAFRKLRGQVQDASKNEESIALVQKMYTAAVAASQLTPAKTQDLPEEDRAKFTAEFQKSMKDFATTLEKLEAALKAGDNAGAAKLVGEMRSLQKEGHKKFQRADEKEKKP